MSQRPIFRFYFNVVLKKSLDLKDKCGICNWQSKKKCLVNSSKCLSLRKIASLYCNLWSLSQRLYPCKVDISLCSITIVFSLQFHFDFKTKCCNKFYTSASAYSGVQFWGLVLPWSWLTSFDSWQFWHLTETKVDRFDRCQFWQLTILTSIRFDSCQFWQLTVLSLAV